VQLFGPGLFYICGMNFQAFLESLREEKPPAGLSAYLVALWYEARGNWELAHSIIQDIDDSTAAWIHAYLHRKEGDSGNADYWYRRANRKRPIGSLEDESAMIIQSLLT